MIRQGKGGARTISGIKFEKTVTAPQKTGINLSKHLLYKYLASHGINWRLYISRKLIPDECYLDFDLDELRIYEKKSQLENGSIDEKPQTCAFKIAEFKKLLPALGVHKISYTYIFSNWFKHPKYKDMLDYIKTVPGCDYIFVSTKELLPKNGAARKNI